MSWVHDSSPLHSDRSSRLGANASKRAYQGLKDGRLGARGFRCACCGMASATGGEAEACCKMLPEQAVAARRRMGMTWHGRQREDD